MSEELPGSLTVIAEKQARLGSTDLEDCMNPNGRALCLHLGGRCGDAPVAELAPTDSQYTVSSQMSQAITLFYNHMFSCLYVCVWTHGVRVSVEGMGRAKGWF